ncbi:MAG TPA: YfjP family GTPase [Streptosporangiaceae bacterium]|jgi:GTP-binding protein EngB required for normal cell division|nr:YfjP family GTPase [Streptosporangiaceae bacterium]
MTMATSQVGRPATAHGAAPGLPSRLAALESLVELGRGRVDAELLDDTGVLLDRAGQRLMLSGDHSVVALAGGTGSGKSSLFNAVCGLELSPVAVRRPTTSAAHACVWGLEGAGPLLDWLNVDKRYRYARASALDRVATGPDGGLAGAGRGENSLQGLVLLDLPDHDSIQTDNREEADRFVAVADLLVWVLDPQKYADAALHRNYIVPYAQHAAVTLIVLNQVDVLRPEEIDDCVADLRRLLEAEGLHDPHIVTTSAVTGAGVDDFRQVLVDTVAARRVRSERLSADVDKLAARFTDYCAMGTVPAMVDERRAASLFGALTEAAGVPAVAEAMESAYELRAVDYMGWPISRAVARLRRDPLRKMRLTALRDELRGAFTGPIGAQQGDVDNALQGVTDGVAADLPEAWQRSVRRAAREHAEELPDALGQALKDSLPAFNQVPRWWWLVKTWQYFLVFLSLLGLGWTLLLVVYGVFDLGSEPTPLISDPGLLPYVALVVLCPLGIGYLTASMCRNVAALSAAKHGERVEQHMRDRIVVAARQMVLDPVAEELSAVALFRAEADTARGL